MKNIYYGRDADIWPIWRRGIIFIVLADLVKVVFIQLSHKAREVAVLEVLRQDQFRKFLILWQASTMSVTKSPEPYGIPPVPQNSGLLRPIVR